MAEPTALPEAFKEMNAMVVDQLLLRPLIAAVYGAGVIATTNTPPHLHIRPR